MDRGQINSLPFCPAKSRMFRLSVCLLTPLLIFPFSSTLSLFPPYRSFFPSSLLTFPFPFLHSISLPILLLPKKIHPDNTLLILSLYSSFSSIFTFLLSPSKQYSTPPTLSFSPNLPPSPPQLPISIRGRVPNFLHHNYYISDTPTFNPSVPPLPHFNPSLSSPSYSLSHSFVSTTSLSFS